MECEPVILTEEESDGKEQDCCATACLKRVDSCFSFRRRIDFIVVSTLLQLALCIYQLSSGANLMVLHLALDGDESFSFQPTCVSSPPFDAINGTLADMRSSYGNDYQILMVAPILKLVDIGSSTILNLILLSAVVSLRTSSKLPTKIPKHPETYCVLTMLSITASLYANIVSNLPYSRPLELVSTMGSGTPARMGSVWNHNCEESHIPLEGVISHSTSNWLEHWMDPVVGVSWENCSYIAYNQTVQSQTLVVSCVKIGETDSRAYVAYRTMQYLNAQLSHLSFVYALYSTIDLPRSLLNFLFRVLHVV